ncbi:MAG: hypothetical protein AAF696_12920 [Bacteroidota bacterium]
MYHKDSRIYFLDNPYPDGHKLKEFSWSIRLIPSVGLWFDLHLETEKYYAEDESTEEEDEEESDWKAKIVWGNYHSCKMSSTYWHKGGFLGGSAHKKFDFNKGMTNFFHIDPLPRPKDFDIEEDRPFFIYLLGHDDCADHKITFHKEESGKYRIGWKGKIALSYAGDFDFNYDFSSEIQEVEIPKILCPHSLSETEIKDLLHKYAIGYEDLQIARYELSETTDEMSRMKMEDSSKKGRASLWDKLKALWS